MKTNLEVASLPQRPGLVERLKPRRGLCANEARLRPSYSPVIPARNRAYLKALRAAEIAAWKEPGAAAAGSSSGQGVIAPAIRIGPPSYPARLESLVMTLLFLFAAGTIVLQFAAVFGDHGFLGGVNEFVRRAIE